MADEIVVVTDARQEPWYELLVDDCKAIMTEGIFNSRWTLLETYHQLGERIVTDNNFDRKEVYGKKIIAGLRESLRTSESTIWRAVQFYEKYPQLETVPEGKNISWNKIITKYLPNQTQQSMDATVFSHKSLEYYTPEWVLDAARLVMGGIDLDPASCIEAQENVKAIKYYTLENDGLSKEWHGRVWLNPPYSKTNGKSNQEIWANKLIEQYECGNVNAALLLVKAALGYKWFEKLFDKLPVCFLSNRLSFILEDGNDDGQSKQGTTIFYLGDDFDRFLSIFRKYGRVVPNSEDLDALLR